ncbi:MAG: hypothetical protein K2F97_06825 [Muribaculaceae bacterium]|nr:hypothetical protein [Muribaculaceae bacterium]MDE6487089.1 hypothetical protein [Muribaculaceae bacterium]
MKNNTPRHSPKISRMLADIPARLVGIGWAVTLGLLAAFILAVTLIPSPYDSSRSIASRLLSAFL